MRFSTTFRPSPLRSETNRSATFRSTAALIILSAATFTYVTTEVMPIGVLTLIAKDLHRSESDIGFVVTAYAAVVLVASLPLTKLTARVPRRVVLTSTLGVFAVATLAAALAPTYDLLLAARLLTALTQGLFWAVVGPAAAGLFAPELSGRTVARLALGTSLAPVLGIPFGTWLGQLAGWRVPFLVMAVVNGLTCVLVTVLVPRTPRETGDDARGTAPDRRLFVLLLIGVLLVVTGFQTVWTYVTPYLLDVSGFADGSLATLLLVGGVCGVVGTSIAGRYSDRHPWPSLIIPMGLVAVALTILFAFGQVEAAAVGALALNGFGFSGFAASLQGTILRIAPMTVDMGMAAVGSIFNAGIAGGAYLGGLLLDGPGVRSVAFAGAVLCALSFAVLAIGTRTTRTAAQPSAPKSEEIVAA
ncbi:MFS transporter [Hamadaea tsunoensis]|uniref:MFS transporter n=1 Tax=Hamadaea tsunoensis TaxID=53368 RepID=UPI0003F978B2|nr:MFS transporter [Hamadaea tsunoensis]